MTIGVEFGTHTHTLDNGDTVKLQIWDTAGQESFKSITRSYYRNSVCALVVFDVTDESSFKNVSGWINDVKTYSHLPVTIVLVGNKCDLENKRKVKREDAEKFARDRDMPYYETSAKTGQNVNLAFLKIVRPIYDKIKDGTLDITYGGSMSASVISLNKSLSDSKDDSKSYCSGCGQI